MDYREYENRVADVLAFLAGDSASVERNQMCWGTLSGGYRQIDVLVEGRVGDLANATMIGDCKRWSHTVDVADVGCFIDLAQDVGADVGLLMVSGKVSERAHKRAKNEEGRGIRIDVLDVDDLARWNPPGMLSTTYRFPIQYREVAIRRLRNAGFRVQGSRAPEPTKIEAVIEVSCHYGIRNPGIDTQRGHWDRARAALKEAGVHDPVHVGHGIVVNGGDPRRPWVRVAIDGQPIDLLFQARDEAEASAGLDEMMSMSPFSDFCATYGIDRSRPSIIKPEGWPVQNWPLRGCIGPRASEC